MKTINWGIVGLGNIAQSFVNDFKHTHGGRIVAAASRTKDKALAFCKANGIPEAFGSYEALMASDNIDVIYIATPHNLHFNNTINAIKAGKGVLCEKPISTNTEDLQILMETSKKHEMYLMEAMWTYFLPPILRAKSWIEDGQIGAVKYIKADFAFKADYNPESRLFNPELAGGALLDIGIYPIALALLVFDQEPVDIQTTVEKAPTGVDLKETMVFRYSNGSMADLYAALDHETPWEALILGTEGYIKIPDFFKSTKCFLYKEKKVTDHFVDQRKSIGYNYEIDAVHKDLWSQRIESEIMPLRKSMQLQRIMDRVKKQF